MAKYIATYSDTINDVEVTGFCTLTDKEVEKMEELAASITWSFVFKVGDERIDYSSGEDLLSRIDFREISNDEYKHLNKIFDLGFGVYITEDFLLEVAGDEDLEIEDELDSEDDDYYRPNSSDDDDDDY